MKMLTIESEKGSFSPTHITDKDQFMQPHTLDKTIETIPKMVMKKRTNKRNTDFPLFPPINQTGTPLNHRRDLTTPYLDHGARPEVESPYIGGFSRAHGAATPYVAPSHYSKQEFTSPFPGRDPLHRLSHMSHANVLELGRIRKEVTFTNDPYKIGPSSPFIERKNKVDKKTNKKNNENDQNDSEKDLNLQIRSNQIGLLDRHDKFRYSRGFRMDEPFSIRKKIEQFRKWHEEQYREKIRKLKVEVDNQYEADHIRITKSTLAKHTARTRQEISGDGENKENKDENKEKQNEKDENGNYKKDDGIENKDKTNEKEQKESKNNDVKNEQKDKNDNSNEKNDNSSEKAPSQKTWKTWRGVNESYAYTDVKKYIEENELLSQEKESYIEKWVVEVEDALGLHLPKIGGDNG